MWRPLLAPGDGYRFVSVTRPPRPLRFERYRWLGDKRTLLVHDLDHVVAACAVEKLASSGQAAAFGPDLLAEARNRGYRPHGACVGGDRGGDNGE
ncbi:MAG: hypothetical protein QOF30_1773 [Acidimicrobiaceae bacterium]|jgi:hypothetical protein|nr:hypothetical protein [Acidimicrobiaceae bacterium]